MKTLTIMRGLPGAGKSTWVQANRPEGSRVCNADAYFTHLMEKWNDTKLARSAAHGACLRECVNWMTIEDSGSDIFIDNTNITVVDMAPYVALGRAYGYKLRFVQIGAGSRQEYVDRNVHGVTMDVLLGMDKRWNDEVEFPYYWKPFEVLHVLSDGAEGRHWTVE